MEDPDETEIAGLRQGIGAFCVRKGYRLRSVFVDRGVRDDALARAGFTGLLEAVRATGAIAVVVPALAHLSAIAFFQDALIRMVQVAGGQVVEACLNEDRGTSFEIGSGRAPGAVS